MQHHFKYFLFPLLLIFSGLVYASSYIAVIDSGSSGSEIFLYKKYDHFKLKEVYVSEKIKPGLANYKDKPLEAYTTHIKPLLLKAQSHIAEPTQAASTPVFIYATAGMRLIPKDTQTAIYKAINTNIKKDKDVQFKIVDAKTITGTKEGIYAWLAVNYLSNTLDNTKKQLGVLDVGGASSEVAFIPNDSQLHQDIERYPVHLSNGFSALVYSRSDLGYGFDQSRFKLVDEKDHIGATCFPDGYPVKNRANIDVYTGKFNSQQCSSAITTTLFNQALSLPNFKDVKFVAVSGYAYTYEFYKRNVNLNALSQLSSAVNDIYKGKTWDIIKKSIPNEREKYLSRYAYQALYMLNLLKWYGVQNNDLLFTNTINNQDAGWALGVAVCKYNFTKGQHRDCFTTQKYY